MSTNITHGQLTARLVAETCLPMVQGRPQATPPVQGVLLTAGQRSELGFTNPLRMDLNDKTVLYRIAPDGVFVDLQKASATIWFNHADSDKAITLLDDALKRAYPRIKQGEEKDHPDAPGMRARFYSIDFEGGRAAKIEVNFPARGSDAKQFVVRVNGVERAN